MKYAKYHALGNDYIVIDPREIKISLTPQKVMRICDRHFGAGSDGILYGPIELGQNSFSLKIFNPDGGEAESSGNGLRIFSRYLWDKGNVGNQQFSVITPGGTALCQVLDDGHQVQVEMGKVSFLSTKIPVLGKEREVLEEKIKVGAADFIFSAANIGNPHCVIIRDDISEKDAKRFGPALELDPMFPKRINVQFVKVIDRKNIQIEIWERGAGYTLASGTSSCAAAAVCHRLNLCDKEITVHMPGGTLEIIIKDEYQIQLTGPVTRVSEGEISEEIFNELKVR